MNAKKGQKATNYRCEGCGRCIRVYDETGNCLNCGLNNWERMDE